MELFAKIKDSELLFSLIHELGTTFYKPLGQNKYRVIYFSGRRFVIFEGEIPQEKLKNLERFAWKVDEMEIDEENNILKIIQK